MIAGAGLVLEGGGMRATYTGSVLDALLDAGVSSRDSMGLHGSP